MTGDPRRSIPAVDTLLATGPFQALIEEAGRPRVVRELRRLQASLRDLLGGRDGTGEPASGPDASDAPVPAPSPVELEDPAWYAARVAAALERGDRPSLRRVINATGVVLHTNLGRAPLAEVAVRAMTAAAGYGSLEYDLEAGVRGSRYDHCVGLLRELTGAEAALVVNNNAAAVVLVLNTLAEGREVLISRGELVEIGGSFRVPEIMARSGARMREVGATNRTHLADYEAGVEDAALILKVHRSNFRVEGFTAEVEAAALAELARGRGIPLVHDLGSGALLDLTRLGLPAEPTAREALAAGAHVVTMSGDKLLGGPQAGIIVGDAAAVGAMRANPLCRALRPDKLTLAALEATLALYRDPDRAVREIPTLAMLGASPDELRGRAERLARTLGGRGVAAAVEETTGAVGGGAYPGVELPGFAVVIRGGDPGDGGHGDDAGALATRLRGGAPPVVGTVRDGRLWLDLRTVAPDEEAALVDAVAGAVVAGDAGRAGGSGSGG